MFGRVTLTALAVLLVASQPIQAQSGAQATYWWQDEIRSVAFDLSKARTGAVAQWPKMTIAAGSIRMPVPTISDSIDADGSLDEPVWQQATAILDEVREDR